MSWLRSTACLALLLPAASLRADSWAPPQRKLAVSRDGAWYLLSEPEQNPEARLRLFQVLRGGPPSKSDLQVDGGSRLPRRGDRLVAQTTGPLPMHIHCLSEGAGFVTFETYGQIGTRTVAARYDHMAKELWSLQLADLFSKEEIQGFRATISSIWWYEAQRLDERAQELIVTYEVPRAAPAKDGGADPDADPAGQERGKPGLLRISLVDGTRRSGAAVDWLRLADEGSAEERVAAIDALSRARPPGWMRHLTGLLDEEADELAVRVQAAIVLAAAGDLRGRALLLDAARQGVAPEVRARALEALPTVVGAEALPLLKAALREEQPELGLALWRAFEALGVGAIDALIGMAQEEPAPASYRILALRLLAGHGAVALRAVPALARLAADGSGALREEAQAALEALHKAAEAAK